MRVKVSKSELGSKSSGHSVKKRAANGKERGESKRVKDLV